MSLEAQLFGISRQGLYKRKKAALVARATESDTIKIVRKIRKYLPRLGGKKLHYVLHKYFNAVHSPLGRDRLFKTLREAQLLVPRRKRYFITTNSKHQFYKHPNRTFDLELTMPEQLWVSDITYIRTADKHLYLSLVTDAYSRKIVGYHLADHLKATGPVEALKMALRSRMYPGNQLTHHSDRGIQYCSEQYVGLLHQNGIMVSMTTCYDPYENAKAERVNGILKNEFEWDAPFPDFKYANREITKAIRIYNNMRPHLSNHYLTPEEAHQKFNPNPIKLDNLWHSIYQ